MVSASPFLDQAKGLSLKEIPAHVEEWTWGTPIYVEEDPTKDWVWAEGREQNEKPAWPIRLTKCVVSSLDMLSMACSK